MLESFPFSVFLGGIFGFLAGLGIGGGSLLVLWLTVVLGMEPDTARSINLLFFIPTALIACFFRKKTKNSPYRTLTKSRKKALSTPSRGIKSCLLSGILQNLA